jgi:hypothetical protein
MAGATWKVLVDWDRDGDFSETNEDITSYVQQMTFNCGFRQAFQDTADEMRATFTLWNDDQRFSPEFSGGPLYGIDWLLRPVKVLAVLPVVDNSGNPVVDGMGNPVVVERVMWRGWTDPIQPAWNVRGTKIAILSATGPRRFLTGTKVFIPVQENKRSDEIIRVVLDKVKVPPAVANGPWALGVPGYSEIGITTYLQSQGLSYSLEQGRQTFEYAADTWEDGITALDAIDRTVKAERGRFYFNREGRAVFWNRHHLMKKTAVDDTITDDFQGATYGYGENLANIVNLRYKPRSLDDAAGTLWVMNDPIRIRRRDEKTLRARFGEQESDSKVSALDVEMPKTADGTLVFSQGSATIKGWEVDARGAKFTLKPVGKIACRVTHIEIRGRKLTAYNDTEINVQDGESRFLHGESTFSLSLEMLNDGDAAERIARYELARRKTPRGAIKTLHLRGVDDTKVLKMLNLTVGNRITLTEAQTGNSADYFIIGEEHQVSEALMVHDVTWTLEPASTQKFWVLGVSRLGIDTVLAPI